LNSAINHQEVDNYWLASLYRKASVVGSSSQPSSVMALHASQVAKSWNVHPPLKDIAIEIVGGYKAAGSISEISISFVPENNADTLEVMALFPLGFDFSKANTGGSVTSYMVSLTYSLGNRLVITNAIINSNERCTFRIANVKLGLGGGPTKFSLATFTGGRPIASRRADESPNVRNGFRLPGNVVIKTKTISVAAVLPGSFQSYMRIRVNERCLARFDFVVTRTVKVGSKIIISSTGVGAYPLSSTQIDVVLKGPNNKIIPVTVSAISKNAISLKVRKMTFRIFFFFQLSGDSNDITNNIADGVLHILTIIAFPRQGSGYWLLRTDDNDPDYSLNTNDGLETTFTGPLAPVTNISVFLFDPTAAPTAKVDVVFTLSNQPLTSYRLDVILPPGFEIPANKACGPSCTYNGVFNDTLKNKFVASVVLPADHLGRPVNNTMTITTPTETPTET
jgi:hypothetical protein